MLKAHADPRPAAIIQKFNLTAPQYSKVACYGHFGSNAAEMPWEQTDIAKTLRR
jgi:S-adenosylmethionine synthetase